jgi:hypothetical protein
MSRRNSGTQPPANGASGRKLELLGAGRRIAEMVMAEIELFNGTANGADPDAEGKLSMVREYLKAGHGRGRLHSEATIYQGKAGYFCVSGTGAQEVLLFCCMPHDDILLASAQQVPPA